ERGATGRAARLPVVIGEQDSFVGDAVDVGSASHHAVGVNAEIPHTNVVAKDHHNVRLLVLRERHSTHDERHECHDKAPESVGHGTSFIIGSITQISNG